VISSPAGERGRAGNYAYGSAKAAVTTFASSLRHRLTSKGVRVASFLPGFVDIPKTAGFKKGILWVKPESVARVIQRALQSLSGVLCTPWL
jgi:decaprenylphospho-beta-D-erythro-pentofuranosid-2-ulose 2-reductase